MCFLHIVFLTYFILGEGPLTDYDSFPYQGMVQMKLGRRLFIHHIKERYPELGRFYHVYLPEYIECSIQRAVSQSDDSSQVSIHMQSIKHQPNQDGDVWNLCALVWQFYPFV